MSEFWDKKIKEIELYVKERGIEGFLEWPAIRATMFVGETPYIRRERRDVRHLVSANTDTNTIHQAFHLYQWLRFTDIDITSLSSIAEIGGGYGAMFCLCRSLGFTGDYYILDYPIMNLIQHYYVEKVQEIKHSFKTEVSGGEVDLLIACHSLSELDLAERERVLSGVGFKHHLIAYGDGVWEGVDNREYFSNWKGFDVFNQHYEAIRYKVK